MYLDRDPPNNKNKTKLKLLKSIKQASNKM